MAFCNKETILTANVSSVLLYIFVREARSSAVRAIVHIRNSSKCIKLSFDSDYIHTIQSHFENGEKCDSSKI